MKIHYCSQAIYVKSTGGFRIVYYFTMVSDLYIQFRHIRCDLIMQKAHRCKYMHTNTHACTLHRNKYNIKRTTTKTKTHYQCSTCSIFIILTIKIFGLLLSIKFFICCFRKPSYLCFAFIPKPKEISLK